MQVEAKERKCQATLFAREEEIKSLTARIIRMQEEMQGLRASLRETKIEGDYWEVHAGDLHRRLEWWPHQAVDRLMRRKMVRGVSRSS